MAAVATVTTAAAAAAAAAAVVAASGEDAVGVVAVAAVIAVSGVDAASAVAAAIAVSGVGPVGVGVAVRKQALPSLARVKLGGVSLVTGKGGQDAASGFCWYFTAIGTRGTADAAKNTAVRQQHNILLV